MDGKHGGGGRRLSNLDHIKSEVRATSYKEVKEKPFQSTERLLQQRQNLAPKINRDSYIRYM